VTRLLITGKSGQVGWELQRSLQCLGEVVAVDREQFDLAQPETLAARLDEISPDVIVNAAAYTAVDKAESDEALATTVNGDAPTELARWAVRRSAMLVHYSTDYVFDGGSGHPYSEDAATCPVNAYGRSKLVGEAGIRDSGCDHLVVRTTWVYASRGKNFLLTMLRLANERPELRVVDDQIGAPTWARSIADVTGHLLARTVVDRRAAGFRSAVVNVASQGATSWHGFAGEIVDAAVERGLVDSARRPRIRAIPSSAYSTPARRPSNSVLDLSLLSARFGISVPDWRVALRLCLDELVR
jgi:dTDP-4-dehydrorhamnose reductase